MSKTSFLALAFLVALSSCQQTANEQPLRTVVVTHPQSTDVDGDGEISLPGTIKEGQTVQVSFKAGGQIARLDVKEGDYVSKGEMIAELDDKDYQIALSASKAQYTQLKNEVERIKVLYERNSVSKNEYEKAAYGLEQVAADLQAKENQIEYTKLHSPASGYVQRVASHVGEMVNAGTAVVTLIDVEQMEVEVELPYNIYQQRENLGDFVAILDGKEYQLKKLNVIPKAKSSQQYTMLLALPTDKNIREASGANVEVRFSVNKNSSAKVEMTVPESAIVYNNTEAAVWVLNQDSTISRRPINLGSMKDGEVVVVQGLEGTETIVRAGATMLYDGEKVKVLKQKSATNPGGLQ